MNPYSKIGKEGAERMQGQDEGHGKDDIYKMKEEFKEREKKKRINYLYNHYGIDPIYKAKEVQINGNKYDANMDIDLFPENKFDLLDEKNKTAIG